MKLEKQMLPRICYIEANLPDFIFGVCEYT